MANECVPAEGATDGSLHWVEHPAYGLRVWGWDKGHRGHLWLTTSMGWIPEDAADRGWRYSHPASPTDAADLAAVRAEYDSLLTSWAELKQEKSKLIEDILDLGRHSTQIEKALEWYADKVSGCRKVTTEGDEARRSLDRDGGAIARASLSQSSASVADGDENE